MKTLTITTISRGIERVQEKVSFVFLCAFMPLRLCVEFFHIPSRTRFFLFFLSLFSLCNFLEAGDIQTFPKEAKESLSKLLQGNDRYVKELLVHPNRSQERREEVSQAQYPFAVIVGCSDSRVSPIIVFDQGLGDLFEVRVAGNVVGPIEIASVEYAALHLHSSLIFVMGHENCGAVKAVLANQTQDIEPIAERIQAAINAIPGAGKGSLEMAVKANVIATVKQLRENPGIAKLIKENKIRVAGGYYHLETGKVELCCDLL